MPRSSGDDDVKDRVDAAAKSKAEKNKDKTKSAAVGDTVKVKKSQSQLALCNNIISSITCIIFRTSIHYMYICMHYSVHLDYLIFE